MDLEIRKKDKIWSAFAENRAIVSSVCRICVIKIVIQMTKNSTKYERIKVFKEDGTVEAILNRRKPNVRNNQVLS